jgi:Na+-translocating ferredoxin:NAD+ oxidoreductase subunit G
VNSLFHQCQRSSTGGSEEEMKKLQSSLKNMLLVLTGVTAVSVALLAYVNELTKGPIAEANAKTLNEALKKVLPEYTNNPVAESDTVFSEKDGKKIVDFIIYPAKNGEKWVGSAVEAKSMGFGGELKVLVGFDAEGKIYNYSLLAHAETPGLGSKADKWFGAYDPAKNEKPVSHEESAKSILGMNPGETPLAVTKDMNGQVDAITASTITSRAFLNAVNAAYQAYKGGEVDTNSGASQKNEPAAAPEGRLNASNTPVMTAEPSQMVVAGFFIKNLTIAHSKNKQAATEVAVTIRAPRPKK